MTRQAYAASSVTVSDCSESFLADRCGLRVLRLGGLSGSGGSSASGAFDFASPSASGFSAWGFSVRRLGVWRLGVRGFSVWGFSVWGFSVWGFSAWVSSGASTSPLSV